MTEVFPRQLQMAVKQGFDRLRGMRKTRAMYVKQYAGQYYVDSQGLTGAEPLNLIHQTVKATVPTLVSQNPVTRVTSPIVDLKDYAWLLGKGLDEINRIVDMKELMRYGIVDALFTMGIFKTGISSSDAILDFGNVMLDNGQIFTENVSLDDFVFDTECKFLKKASFMGDALRVPRQLLLDDNNYDHDEVMNLPRSGHVDSVDKLEMLSKKMSEGELAELEDFVDIVTLWVPGAQQLVTMADPRVLLTDKFLSIQDYYGPQAGPYTFLTLSQPVPDNPMPIAPIGVWFDLHLLANRTMKKTMDQVDARKTLLAYDPGQADQVQAMKDGEDGDLIACNPESIKPVSIGGERTEDSLAVLGQVQYWANYMAGNPDAAQGSKPNTDVATVANIMQSNASVGINDSIDKVYQCAKEISEKQAWYMHHDPWINVPVTHRMNSGEEVQLHLTPEQRKGDFEFLVFDIQAKSMKAPDPMMQAKKVLEFATNVMPGVTQAAMVLQQSGVEFNPTACLKDIAALTGVGEDVSHWFNDPERDKRIMMMMQMGAQPSGKANSGTGSLAGQVQPGGDNINVPSQETEQRQDSQQGSAESQENNQGVY